MNHESRVNVFRLVDIKRRGSSTLVLDVPWVLEEDPKGPRKSSDVQDDGSRLLPPLANAPVQPLNRPRRDRTTETPCPWSRLRSVPPGKYGVSVITFTSKKSVWFDRRSRPKQ